MLLIGANDNQFIKQGDQCNASSLGRVAQCDVVVKQTGQRLSFSFYCDQRVRSCRNCLGYLKILDKIVVLTCGHHQAFRKSVNVNDLSLKARVWDQAKFRYQAVKNLKWGLGNRESDSNWFAWFGIKLCTDLALKVRKHRRQFRCDATQYTCYFVSFAFGLTGLLLLTLVRTHPDSDQDCNERTDCLNPARPVKSVSESMSERKCPEGCGTKGKKRPEPANECDFRCHAGIVA